MITNKKVLLTLYEEGAPAKKAGLFVDTQVGKKVVFDKTRLVPTDVQERTTLHESFVEFSTSDAGVLKRFSRHEWNQMDDLSKLKSHLIDIADGRRFSYKLI